jgi:predicted Zn-dependent protease
MTPSPPFTGIFFDGKTAHKTRVTVRLTTAGLEINFGAGRTALWPYAGLRAQSTGSVSLQLEREVDDPGGPRVESLVMEHPDFPRRLKETAPTVFPGPFGAGLEPKTVVRLLIVLAVAVPALLYLFIQVLLPLASDKLAESIPVAWEEKLGEQLLRELIPPGQESVDRTKQEAISAVADRLLAAHPGGKPPYRFRFHIKKGGLVNAFALPGGIVVIGQGLLNLTDSPEEFAGVLAHELQHVLQKHATRTLIRSLGIGLIMTLATGGEHEIMAALLKTAVGLESLHHSRDMERQADREGMRLIQSAGIDPQGMLRIFSKLQDEEKESAVNSGGNKKARVLAGYLSTHPAGHERIGYLQELAATPGPAPMPLLPGFDWNQMRQTPVEK